MSFDQKLFKHRETFQTNIKGGTFASLIDGYVGDQIVDYYGVPALFKIVERVENPTEFVSLLFLDALITACSHYSGKKINDQIKRDVLVLNTYNCYESQANITHHYPQIILGLKKKWSEEDVQEFNKLFKEYITFYFNLLPAEVFLTIKQDEDLSSMETKYPSLGITISKNVLAEFQKLRKEI